MRCSGAGRGYLGRRGVWMTITPDKVRAPFGGKEIYDKVCRGCGCFEDSRISRRSVEKQLCGVGGVYE